MSISEVEFTQLRCVELESPIPAMRAGSGPVLVRLHGHVLGLFERGLQTDLSAEEFCQTLWTSYSTRINEHLAADLLSPLERLDATGAPGPGELCWARGDAEEPMISVIIATKGRPVELERCLAALVDMDYSSFEVLVVENGTDAPDVAHMIERKYAKDSRIRHLSEAKAGTSRARNVGIREAKGSIVAFTDDDVIIDRHWLKALSRRFSLENNVGCVTGLVIAAELRTDPQRWFEEYGGFSKGYEVAVYDKERKAGYPLLYPFTAGGFGSGNNCAFPKSVLVEFGAFDEKLGPGTKTTAGEDLDVFLAVVLGGMRIAYEPDAVIAHFHRSDYEGLRHQLFTYGVGLTAVFTKWSIRSLGVALRILLRTPLGVFVIFNPLSRKNNHKTSDFPRDLAAVEFKGMIYGPVAYLRSLIAR